MEDRRQETENESPLFSGLAIARGEVFRDVVSVVKH
jgi:hypothetical protein